LELKLEFTIRFFYTEGVRVHAIFFTDKPWTTALYFCPFNPRFVFHYLPSQKTIPLLITGNLSSG